MAFSDTPNTPNPAFNAQALATRMPLNLDLAGLLYVEATKRVESASLLLPKIEVGLAEHFARVSQTDDSPSENVAEERWVDVIQGVGGLEPDCAAMLSDLAVAETALVTAAEAYINSTANHVLEGQESDYFDKLSPVGKWLFLPRVMNLSWQPRLGKKPLQGFSELVTKRNRWVHPKGIKAIGIINIKVFLDRCGLDISAARRGTESVQELIQGLCKAWKGSCGPDWLDAEHAKKHPPCFFLGNAEVSARLGRPGERA